MHWLEKWRRDHQMDRFQFAKEVGVSEALIYILENERNAVTHPLIANDIADYTGATVKQRDSIVHKKHWGTYTPNPARRAKLKKKAANKFQPAPIKTPEPEMKQEIEKPDKRMKGRAVYAVNMDGEIVQEYRSLNEAALRSGMDVSAVCARCRRSLAENEFLVSKISFRYADKYDEAAREAVIAKGAEARKQQATGAWKYGINWYFTINGETKTLKEWAKERGMKRFTLLGRIQRGMTPEEALNYKDMRGGARK